MPDSDIAINEIKGLEDRRYRAMIDGDTAVLDELCSDDLIYTHSKGDHDDKRSYLHKVGSRYFTYIEITHPADRVPIVGGGARHRQDDAKVSVVGRIVHVDNRYLAVWVREHFGWKFVAYQADADHRRLTSIAALLIRPVVGIVKIRERRSRMSRGMVKWFNSQKGYGFIQPQGGGKDVFVHISAVERAGLSGLNEGQVVEYEEVANKGKTSAENLKVHR